MKYKRIHFIGIGGIGMSALARFFMSSGAKVSGSDSADSEIISDLKKEGAKISIGQNGDYFTDDVDCVIYTLAIADDNKELLLAKDRDLPIFTYAQMLGKISSDMYTIAISGTHGKTTTTAMTYAALKSAEFSPNLIVGSLIDDGFGHKTNFISGKDEFFVTEACEYKKSFLNLSPKILVITNIEADHLDFYKNLDGVKDAFMEMSEKVSDDGVIICDFDDKNVSEILKKYGKFENGGSGKCINFRNYISFLPELFVMGEHNILNASAALAIADFLKADLEKAKIGLSQFGGTWRRLEFRGKNSFGAMIYDDYGHHPTEIRATLKALKNKFKDKRLVVFFQPHLYSRTKTLFDDFVNVFKEFFENKHASESESVSKDKLFLLPIYAAREPNDPKVSSAILSEKISGSTVLENFDEARNEIKKCGENDIVLSLGAGDVYHILS